MAGYLLYLIRQLAIGIAALVTRS